MWSRLAPRAHLMRLVDALGLAVVDVTEPGHQPHPHTAHPTTTVVVGWPASGTLQVAAMTATGPVMDDIWTLPVTVRASGVDAVDEVERVAREIVSIITDRPTLELDDRRAPGIVAATVESVEGPEVMIDDAGDRIGHVMLTIEVHTRC